jgi:transcriptional regulator with XRE-family HTH domain
MITKPKIHIDLKQVESLAANGLTQEQIAAALGISESTLHQRKRDSADFAAAIKRGKAKGIALVTNKLMESIKAGNMTGMIFFLKTQAGWKETNLHEVTGANGDPISLLLTQVQGNSLGVSQSTADDDD